MQDRDLKWVFFLCFCCIWLYFYMIYFGVRLFYIFKEKIKSFNDFVSATAIKVWKNSVERREARRLTPPADWRCFPSEEGNKYGPKTEGLSQRSQCQADFTVDVPPWRERRGVPACEYTLHQQGSLCVCQTSRLAADGKSSSKREKRVNQDAAWMKVSLERKLHWWE